MDGKLFLKPEINNFCIGKQTFFTFFFEKIVGNIFPQTNKIKDNYNKRLLKPTVQKMQPRKIKLKNYYRAIVII